MPKQAKTNNPQRQHPAGPVPRHLQSVKAEPRAPLVVDPARFLPKLVVVKTTIRGVTPLIVENFNKKTQAQILAKHEGKAAGKRAPKDVKQLFVDSKYLDEDDIDCFPCGPIRGSLIGASRITDTEKMSVLKQAIFIEHPTDSMRDLLPLEFKECIMRQDPTRNANGQPDIRIRASYTDWKLTFLIKSVENVLPLEKLLELLAHAGLGGLGGWRPAGKKGMGGVFGRFVIDSVE
jgi:hypothetical protein